MKKIIKRILSGMLVIVVLLLCTNFQKVYAVDLVFQAWVQEKGSDSYVLYRTYTTPHKTTIKAYESYNKAAENGGASERVSGAPGQFKTQYNTKAQTSYWIYRNNNTAIDKAPSDHGIFQTYALLFHGKNTIGNYSSANTTATTAQYGYVKMRGNRINSNREVMEANLYTSEGTVWWKFDTMKVNDTECYDTNISEDCFKNHVPLQQNNIAKNTGIDKYNNSNTVNDYWYRMSLVAIDNKAVSTGSEPIYVTDRKLTASVVADIEDQAASKGLFFDSGSFNRCIRVSNMLRAKSFTSGLDSMNNPNIVRHQGAGWSGTMLGGTKAINGATDNLAKATAGRGSVINLFDNILVLPEKSTRVVEVRHINIHDYQQVSTAALADSDTDKTEYEKVILESDGTKTISYKADYGKKYLGYNFANTGTLDTSKAEIASKVATQSVDSKATTYTTPSFAGHGDEAIVVEFYYCDAPAEFTEKHLYYDENGNLITTQTEVKTYNVDDNGNPAVHGSKRTVIRKEPGGAYIYVGAVRKNNGSEPSTISAGNYDKDLQSLDLQIDQNNENNNKSYGLFAYQISTNTIIRHLLYDSSGNYVSQLSREEVKLPTGESRTYSKLDGYDYLGYVKTETETEPSPGLVNPATTVEVTSADRVVNFCYRYKIVNVHVRHLLYNSDGEYKKTLSQSVSTVNSTNSTSVSYNSSFVRSGSPTVEYKGYIKTNDKAIPTIYAYATSNTCTIQGIEVLKDDVYVNFLYQEKPTEKKVAAPEIDAIGKLDIEANSLIKSDKCESSVYKESDGWNDIISLPIEGSIKLGFMLQPKYILGAVDVEKKDVEVEYKNSLITLGKDNAIVKTFNVITKIDLIGPGGTSYSLEGLEETLFTKITQYSYIFPYKYSEYEVNEVKVYKLSNAQINSPGYGLKNTSGYKITNTDIYSYNYKFGNDFDFDFEKGITQIPAMTNLDIEMFMDPTKNTGCTDGTYAVACANMKPVNMTASSTINIGTSIAGILGLAVSSTDHTFNIIENVPVYIDIINYGDGTSEGVFSKGVYRYQVKDKSGNVKDIYRMIDNEKNVEGIIAEGWEKFKEFLAGLVNTLLELFGYEAKINYSTDEQKILIKQMLPNITKDLTDNRYVMFKMYMDIGTKINKIKFIDSKGQEITLAKNSPLEGSVAIHSSNFVEASGNWLDQLKNIFSLSGGANAKSFLFEGYIDMAQTGEMCVTKEGKKLYIEGFDKVKDINAEKNLKDGRNYLTDSLINEKNGIRIFSGNLAYKSWTATKGIISGTYTFNENANTVTDRLYYSDLSTTGTKYIFEATRSEYKKDITQNDEVFDDYLGKKVKSITLLNVYTPINLFTTPITQSLDAEPETQLGEPIASSGITGKVMLETGFEFTIGIQSYSGSQYGNINADEMDDYLKGYYIKFDFDVKELKINDKTDYATMQIRLGSSTGTKYAGGVIGAGQWVFIPKDYYSSTTTKKTIKVAAKATSLVMGSVSYTARALAKNIVPAESASLEAISKGTSIEAFYETYQNICNDGYPYKNSIFSSDSPVYYAEETSVITNENIERLYDFKVTDVKDIDWKNVFRDTSSNKYKGHNGVVYYSGVNKWEVGKVNPITRTSKELGNINRTLPIGPYKHTNGSYTGAPKLGYRISFDVKLTGTYADNKEVIIKPTFYYISKDGSTFKQNIKLYYKDDTNSYVEVGSSQDTYTLTFIPNDGERYTNEEDITYLSKNKEILGTLTQITLEAATMATETYDGMTFYGEYKLPNSTIAIDNTGSITDSSTYLKDGYIGVKFEISHNDPNFPGNKDTIYYNVGLKKTPVPSFGEIANTTQWDFEGYLGSKYDVSSKTSYIKLEKGTWRITNDPLNDIYSIIRGTVVLFDIDSRAATDFN